MLTISKPLSASQARTYHLEEFANARENYYTSAEHIRGEWHGQPRRRIRLRAAVTKSRRALWRSCSASIN